MIEIVSILLVALVIAVIGFIATVVRGEDEPKTPWTKEYLKVHLKVYFFAVVAAALASWLLSYDPTTPAGFIALLGIAYTGFAFVQSLVARGETTAKVESKE